MEIAKGHTIDTGAAPRASPVRSHTTANTGATRLADASAHNSLPTVSDGSEMRNRENTQCIPARRSAPPIGSGHGPVRKHTGLNSDRRRLSAQWPAQVFSITRPVQRAPAQPPAWGGGVPGTGRAGPTWPAERFEVR